MSDETLLTASRRVVRFMNIDNANGGFVTEETQKALDTLERMITEENNAKRASTLLVYARAALQRLNSDLSKGGFVTPETQWALDQLDREVRAVTVVLSKMEVQETT